MPKTVQDKKIVVVSGSVLISPVTVAEAVIRSVTPAAAIHGRINHLKDGTHMFQIKSALTMEEALQALRNQC